MAEEMVQGIATLDCPYKLFWERDYQYEILYNGKKTMWGRANPKMIQDIVNGLNDAYQNGFHKCSVELMNAKTS